MRKRAEVTTCDFISRIIITLTNICVGLQLAVKDLIITICTLCFKFKSTPMFAGKMIEMDLRKKNRII